MMVIDDGDLHESHFHGQMINKINNNNNNNNN